MRGYIIFFAILGIGFVIGQLYYGYFFPWVMRTRFCAKGLHQSFSDDIWWQCGFCDKKADTSLVTKHNDKMGWSPVTRWTDKESTP